MFRNAAKKTAAVSSDDHSQPRTHIFLGSRLSIFRVLQYLGLSGSIYNLGEIDVILVFPCGHVLKRRKRSLLLGFSVGRERRGVRVARGLFSHT